MCLGLCLVPSFADGDASISSPVEPPALEYKTLLEDTSASVVDDLFSVIAGHREIRRRVETEELIAGMLRGLVGATGDAYASVLRIEGGRSESISRGSAVADAGILLSIDRYGRLTVGQVISDSSAVSAGIARGDRILRIGDTNATGYTSWQALPLLSFGGERPLDLVVESPGGRPRRATVRPDRYIPDTIQLRIGGLRFGKWRDDLGGSWAWIRVEAFLAPFTLDEWEQTVAAVRKARSVRAVVLDLRGNSGGDNGCISALGDFFPTGETLVSFESMIDGTSPRETVRNTGTPRSRLMTYPVAVLVDERTASLAEVFAAALRDGRNVPLVGTNTFGKGTTQSWFTLCDRFAVHLTLAKWYTPTGRCVDGVGLEPDVVVTNRPGIRDVDEQLVAGVRILKERMQIAR